MCKCSGSCNDCTKLKIIQSQGLPGLQGDNAYTVWRKIEGNENKTVEEFIEAITGTDGIDGIDGVNGREVEFNFADNSIQWRYVGDPSWMFLAEVSSGPNYRTYRALISYSGEEITVIEQENNIGPITWSITDNVMSGNFDSFVVTTFDKLWGNYDMKFNYEDLMIRTNLITDINGNVTIELRAMDFIGVEQNMNLHYQPVEIRIYN